MNILGLVPARSGSKRLPNKNMSILQDETLVARALRIASEASVFTQIACSTDSEVIAQHVRELGFEVVLRPPEMATDTSRDVEWVNHAFDYFWGGELTTLRTAEGLPIRCKSDKDRDILWPEEDPPPDAFCILRPTNPFRTPETVQRAVKQFEEQADQIDSLRAVQPVLERPEKMWYVAEPSTHTLVPYERADQGHWLEKGYRLSGSERRFEQQSAAFAPLFIQNGCIEIAHTHVLPNSVSGDRIAPFFTEGREGFDINEPRDLEYARYLVAVHDEEKRILFELNRDLYPELRHHEVFEAEDGNLSIRRKKR